VKLLGNLDCEARWSGVALPEAVRHRISLYATLFAACAPDDRDPHDGAPHEIWVPAAVDAARLLTHPRWTPPIVRVGDPTVAARSEASARAPVPVDLTWADPAARAANDRSATLAIAEALGVRMPGACVVGSLTELDAHVAGFAGRAWICKARWTAAGRDRARGSGATVTGELRTRLGRMLDRFGPLVFEPWVDRVADFGVCGEITGDAVTVAAPHQLITDPRGGFLGIALDPVERAIADPLHAVAHAAATHVAHTGYRGPFAIDAFVYRDPDHPMVHHLHPLCELNARHTFGWIARALARRLGIRRLGFDAPPPGAVVLIAPGDDHVTAWCS
jgi:hypothetical protein